LASTAFSHPVASMPRLRNSSIISQPTNSICA
jgi:hypothetical protein